MALLAEIAISMEVGELLRAVICKDTVVVFELELLAALTPADDTAATVEALPGGWSWFGDPENWLGAPPGHLPVDQVAEARRKDEVAAADHLALQKVATTSQAYRRCRCFEKALTC